MKNDLQAIATIFSLVNPTMCAAIFMQIEKDRPSGARIADATKAMLVVLVILMVAAFFGAKILNVFGVSLDAFSVAGGGVLVWIGIAMLMGRSAVTAPSQGTQGGGAENPSLVPLILFAASPGTITGVITISVNHSQFDIPVTAMVGIAAILALTWVLLVMTAKMSISKKGGGMVRDIFTRYMGLIVIAMGVQFMLTGLKAFMGSG